MTNIPDEIKHNIEYHLSDMIWNKYINIDPYNRNNSNRINYLLNQTFATLSDKQKRNLDNMKTFQSKRLGNKLFNYTSVPPGHANGGRRDSYVQNAIVPVPGGGQREIDINTRRDIYRKYSILSLQILKQIKKNIEKEINSFVNKTIYKDGAVVWDNTPNSAYYDYKMEILEKIFMMKTFDITKICKELFVICMFFNTLLSNGRIMQMGNRFFNYSFIGTIDFFQHANTGPSGDAYNVIRLNLNLFDNITIHIPNYPIPHGRGLTEDVINNDIIMKTVMTDFLNYAKLIIEAVIERESQTLYTFNNKVFNNEEKMKELIGGSNIERAINNLREYDNYRIGDFITEDDNKLKRLEIKHDDNKWTLKSYNPTENGIELNDIDIQKKTFYDIRQKERLKWINETLIKLNFNIDFENNIFKKKLFEVLIHNIDDAIDYNADSLDIIKGKINDIIKYFECDLLDDLSVFIKKPEYINILYLARDLYYKLQSDSDTTLLYIIDDINFPKKEKIFNPICNIFYNISNCSLPQCHRFILECILDYDNLASPVYLKGNARDTSDIPRWKNCKDYFSDPNFFDNLKKDMKDTPAIIIFVILIILQFKIIHKPCVVRDHQTGRTTEYEFYEFETVDAWLKSDVTGTLYNQLRREMTDEKVIKDTLDSISSNNKLRTFLKSYLELVPFAFLNSKKAIDECEKARLTNFKNPVKPITLDEIIIYNRGYPYNYMLGGNSNTNINSNDYHILNNQLYNFNNLLMTNIIRKQRGGNSNGFQLLEKDVYVDKNSSLDLAMKMISQTQPSYGIRLKGIIEIFKKLKPITPDLSENLDKYVNKLIQNEKNIKGIIALLSHILKDRQYENSSFDSDAFYNIAEQYAKKSNKNDKLLNESLTFLRSKIIPLYDEKILKNANMLFVMPNSLIETI